MKNFKLITLVCSFLFVFSSCEKENVITNETNTITEEIIGTKRSELPDDIRLDYHEKYGVIKAEEYPMEPKGTPITFETFLEKTDIKKEDIASYRISEKRFTGIGLSEHRIDGEVIQVAHEYRDEPVQVMEGKLHNGQSFYIIIIIICSNGTIIIIIL